MISYVHWIRQHVGHEKILLVFASACICDLAGRVLWQRRSDFGGWGLPGGVLERYIGQAAFIMPGALFAMIPRHARRVRDALANRPEAFF